MGTSRLGRYDGFLMLSPSTWCQHHSGCGWSVAQTALGWDGPSWEEHCLNLLRMRYKAPGQFERIPSSDQGDLGVEGFSHDGCVYQCYAPDGPLPIKDRYEKQRDKLTEDLGKLERYQDELVKILGGVVITVYVFMTPIHDSKRLNLHAKTKAAEIRAKGLPHCAQEFDVVIHTEADYLVEQSELISLGLQKWQLTHVQVAELAVQTYCESNPDLIATIDGKLTRMPGMNAGPYGAAIEAIGVRRAQEMSFTGNFVSASEAHQWGLVNHVVPHDELLSFTRSLARDIVSNDGDGVRQIRSTYAAVTATTVAKGWEVEARDGRLWRESRFDPEQVAQRRAAIIDRGRRQA